MSSIVPFKPLEARPLASELSPDDLLPQHRVLAYCEKERTVFDVLQGRRNERQCVKWVFGLYGSPGVAGAVLALVDVLAVHSHKLMQIAEGGIGVTGFFGLICLVGLSDILAERKTNQRAMELDSPRAAREQAGEYERDSQHVQWAPRVLAREGKVIVQQCRWMPINGEETTYIKKHSLARAGAHYAIEPMWEREFDPDEIAAVAGLMSELNAEAADLERAGWTAYTEKRAEVLVQREREQLAQVAARGTALSLAAT